MAGAADLKGARMRGSCRALELGITGEPRAQALFALVAVSRGKPREQALAEKRFEEALALSPDGGHALWVGATLLAEAGDFAQVALQRAKAVLEALPVWDADAHESLQKQLDHVIAAGHKRPHGPAGGRARPG
jgi:hypothetical protein